MANWANLWCWGLGHRARRVAAIRGSAGWRRRAVRRRLPQGITTTTATTWMCQKIESAAAVEFVIVAAVAVALLCIHRGREWIIPWVGGQFKLFLWLFHPLWGFEAAQRLNGELIVLLNISYHHRLWFHSLHSWGCFVNCLFGELVAIIRYRMAMEFGKICRTENRNESNYLVLITHPLIQMNK